MMRDLTHIASRLYHTPLFISEEMARHLSMGLQTVMLGRAKFQLPPVTMIDDKWLNTLQTEVAQAVMEVGEDETPTIPRHGYRIERGVAVVPVHGVLVRRAGQMDAQSTPLMSYERLARVLNSVRANARVNGVLLDIDSPGGEASGIFELTRRIRTLADTKPTWAVADDNSLSAAYALAAATNQIWVTDTGSAGSVGAVALHIDQSEQDSEAGLKYTYIYRGAHKIDRNPHGPLSAPAMQAISGEVGRLYDILVNDIHAHRRSMSVQQLRDQEAAIYHGANAVTEGLADRLGTLDEAHSTLVGHVQAQQMQRTHGISNNAPRGASAVSETTGEQVRTTSGEGQTDTTNNNTSTNNTVSTTTTTAQSDQPHAPAPVPPPVPQPAQPQAQATTQQNVNTNVVQLAVERQEERQRAQEIVALCNLAGFPDMASDAIQNGITMSELRDKLQRRQAEASSQRRVQSIDTSQDTGNRRTRNVQAELRQAVETRFAAQRTGKVAT